jgi:hypothetical protein
MTMYTYTHGLDSHIQATTDRRIDDALKAEQIRIARGGQQGRISLVANRLRTLVGTLLISTGERLRQESMGSTAAAPLKRHATGTA